MTYDITKLINQSKQTIKEADEAQSKFSNSAVKIAFLPEGTHTVRIIPDENLEFFTEVAVHKPDGKYIRCNRQRWDDPVELCPICQAVEKANENEIPLNFNTPRQVLRKMYMYLIDSTAKSEYWTPGTLYCVIVNKRVTTAFTNVLKMFDNIEDPTIKQKAFEGFDPSKPCNPIVITFTKGSAGSCSMNINSYTTTQPIDISAAIPQGKEALPDLETVYIDNTKPAEEAVINEGAKHVYDFIFSKSKENGATTPVTPAAQPQAQMAQLQVAPQAVAQPQVQVAAPQVVQPQAASIQPTTINTANVAPSELPPAPQTTGGNEPW